MSTTHVLQKTETNDRRASRIDDHEEPILHRIAAGEEEAVSECMDRFGGLVWSIARRLSPSREDAEDGVQQAFVQIWKSAGRYDPEKASEATFIAMITRRTFISRLRKIGRRPQQVSLENAPDPSDGEHHRMESSAEAALAGRFFLDLSDDQQRTIRLSIVQGMSHSEIAEELDMPLGTVKSHIRRGLQALRDLISDHEQAAREAWQA